MGLRGTAQGATLPGIAAACAALLIGSLFLPWLSTDIGPPFSPESTSGWDGTPGVARLVMALAAGALLANVALALAAAGRIVLDAPLERALAWAAAALAGGALCLVAYRIVVLPEPAEFLSRAVGLYVALAAAVVTTLLSGAGALARAGGDPGR